MKELEPFTMCVKEDILAFLTYVESFGGEFQLPMLRPGNAKVYDVSFCVHL